MNELLLIMARAPELGKVKTRLAKTLGEQRALEVYIKLLEHTLKHAKESGYESCVYVDGDPTYFKHREWKSEVQAIGDLGEKMKDSFSRSFALGYTKVVMIGTDCYEINSESISIAFGALSSCDVVLGPALDGGYYLIGMKKMHLELFDSMPWSTSDLYTKTLDEARRFSVSTHSLDVKSDIDEEKDLVGTDL